MPKNLVIVESPAKAGTISKYLGKDYKVLSSYGHITDLPKKDMGISIENNFKPIYEVSSDKKQVVKKLKEEATKAEIVWLASDEDREGEAISWHLYNELGLTDSKTRRIVFNQITKSAIEKAIANPRKIDKNLVDAQQARRVLDRLVGFEVSPVLWRKVKPGLSAGRVQSVAVRLIVEREREIKQFEPKSSFSVTGIFKKTNGQALKASLSKDIQEEKPTKELLEQLTNATFSVDSIEKKPSKRTPSAPFTTSTLQQEASRKLGYSVSRTMRLAQQLYEAGHITYMRTDSVHLAPEALAAAQQTIHSNYGEKYVQPRKFKSKNKGAQEAHEAIRPTDFNNRNVSTDHAQQKLYELIWKRTIAGQMADAKLERTIISILNNKNDAEFRAKGEVILFDGFLKVYQESQGEDTVQEDSGLLPKVEKGEELKNNKIEAIQKFTKSPPRFTEASLVKRLEELGIGRPSTYAPTISTIQSRGYVEKSQLEGKTRKIKKFVLTNAKVSEEALTETYGADKNKMIPTDIGMVVTDFLVDNFDKILDYQFTAKVEEDFDSIAEGKQLWSNSIQDFYADFHDTVEDVKENAERATGERLLGVHPETGKNVYSRIGRYGAMIQMGDVEDEEKPSFASLPKNLSMDTVTLEEALPLLELPKELGLYEDKPVEVNIGRFGPYVKFDGKYVSIPKTEDVHSIDIDQAIAFIEEKRKADAPIAEYKGLDVTKGKGRFGPFIKWNELFINVNKKYDFDNLSQADIEELIELKLKKEREKVIHNWEDEGIRVEKARWGRHNIIQGKTKIEISKDIDAKALTLDEVKKILEQRKPKKKTTRKKSSSNKTK